MESRARGYVQSRQESGAKNYAKGASGGTGTRPSAEEKKTSNCEMADDRDSYSCTCGGRGAARASVAAAGSVPGAITRLLWGLHVRISLPEAMDANLSRVYPTTPSHIHFTPLLSSCREKRDAGNAHNWVSCSHYHMMIAVYEHPLPTSVSRLIAALTPHLPNSLTLIRRLQDARANPRPTSHLLATFPSATAALPATTPFALVLFDHTTSSGIHAYAFSSLELSESSTSHVRARNIVALLSHCRTLPDVPPVILLGCTHANTAALLRTAHVDCDDVYGPGGPYARILLPSSAVEPAALKAAQIAHGLVMDQIRPHDYARVMARNSLVRSTRTLENRISMAVRRAGSPDPVLAVDEAIESPTPGDLVAWAFIEEAGSVRTLHCEPEYRRQGLARVVVTNLIAEARRRGVFDVEGFDCSAHMVSASVDRNNIQSVGLFKSLGGELMWDEYWVRIDLAKCTEFIARGHDAAEPI